MAEKKLLEKFAGVSDAAVLKATGKGWKEWFALLDQAGAKELPHRAIAEWVEVQHQLSGWWSQMVTVAYEQARGLRALHQKSDGYAANVSKTFEVSLDRLYDAWDDTKLRAGWLKEKGFKVTQATANKSMRILWGDGASRVDVTFYPKGEDKTQVTVQHSKLDSAKDVQASKAQWKSALEQLQKKLASLG